MMKCPHCGGEIPEGAQCKTCGTEIHYKDFRGSEMLDIRIPSPPPKPKEKIRQKSASSPREEGLKLERPSAEKPALSKPAFFLVAAISIIFAALAWYFLLKFLLKF